MSAADDTVRVGLIGYGFVGKTFHAPMITATHLLAEGEPEQQEDQNTEGRRTERPDRTATVRRPHHRALFLRAGLTLVGRLTLRGQPY